MALTWIVRHIGRSTVQDYREALSEPVAPDATWMEPGAPETDTAPPACAEALYEPEGDGR